MATDERRLIIHSASVPAEAEKKQRRPLRIKTRLTMQERLLRSSCIACALLLGLLALGSINHPLARKASQTVEAALTMEIDLDRSLGQLSFVQKLMPESALVFFNLSGKSELEAPVEGAPSHAYSESQPWLMFDCLEETEAAACASGTVAAVSQLSDGSYGVLIDHGEGRESVTACLASVCVRNGDTIGRGDVLGASGKHVYFELREGGAACDPTALMGL